METTYFIPIKSMNLAHYLSNGIIAPAKYIVNRNQDLQNNFLNNLLLSTSKFTVETNCAIEVVFNEQEEAPRKISDNFFVFDMPLPISRIKGIYFTENEQKVSTVFNITSGAAFIPENILFVSKDNAINLNELRDFTLKTTEVNWSHYLRKFDQLMGGFALMRIGKDDFQNYPTHYIRSLGNINKYFNELLKEQNIEIENTFELAFTDNGNFKSFHDTIYSEVTTEVVSKYAAKDNIKLETRNGLIQVDKIPENKQTYLVAILDSYGQGKRKQIDSFVSDLVSGNFNEKRKEGLSLIFGINKGYASFRNKYKTNNFEASVKFKLDSKLDYYTIESIYQFVFNEKSSLSSYKYIDNWCPQEFDYENINSKFVSYKVLDKTIILKKKEDFFIELFRTSLAKRDRLFEIISKNISRTLPKYLPLDTNLFKEQLQDEYEEFFKEYSQFIVSETLKKSATEYENLVKILNNKIAELTSQIENKENINETLQKKIVHLNSQETKVDEKGKLGSENISTEKREDGNPKSLSESIPKQENEKQFELSNENQISDEINKIEMPFNKAVIEPQDSYSEGFSGSLFSDENLKTKRKIREKELKAMKLPDLKSIISDYKLKPVSNKKDDLINDILAKEF